MSDLRFAECNRLQHPFYDITKNGLRVGGISWCPESDKFTVFFVGGHSSSVFRFTAREMQEIGRKANELNNERAMPS